MNNLQYRINRFIDEEVSINILLISIVVYLYGFFFRNNIFGSSLSKNKHINSWDIIINFPMDTYLVLYFLTPLVLYTSLKVIHSGYDYTLLIRLGSYKGWIIKTVINFVKKIGILFFILFTITLLLLIGVPRGLGWSDFALLNNGITTSYPANILADYINSPFLGLFLMGCLILLTYISVHIFLTLIYLITNKITITSTLAVFFWLMCLMSFKWLPSDYSFLILPNYLSLAHGVHSFGNIGTPFLVVIILLTVLLFICSKIDLKFKLFISLSPKYIYYLLVLLSLSLMLNFNNKEIQSLESLFVTIFFGSSKESTTLLGILAYIIIYFGYVHLLLLSLHSELTNLSYIKLLRYQSLIPWLWSILRSIVLSVTIFLALLYLTVVSIYILLGYSAIETYLNNLTFVEITYHFFVNGILQMLFYIILSFLIAWISKEMFNAIMILGILLLFMFPGLNKFLIIPIGLNSMGFLVDGISPYRISLTLILYLIINLSILYFFIVRKDFTKLT